MPIAPLPASALHTPCDLDALEFVTTADLQPPPDGLPQPRAEEAVELAMGLRHSGYNLFVMGEPGSGRHATVRRMLEARAARAPGPDDWCYVYNFTEPGQPRALRLPAGRGERLRRDMQQFITELGQAIGAAFDSDDYRARIESIQEAHKQREEQALRDLGQASGEEGVALIRTPQGFVFAPMKGEETMDPEAFKQLPEAEIERLREAMARFGERLQKLLRQFPRWRREMQGEIRTASRETMALVVDHLVDELRERYADLPQVCEFLDQVQRDAIEAGESLREQERTEGDTNIIAISGNLSLARYQVNVLVDNSACPAAPVVWEDHPTYPNLAGRVDQLAHMGTLITNFTMIRNGALHRANGGYLLLDAQRVLSQPYAWDGLKRALKNRQVRIESLGQVFGYSAGQSLEPQPIPLDVKIVLFGERGIYYLLQEYDPEFAELFKVAADFDDDLPRGGDSILAYSRLIAGLVRGNALRPLDRAAVGRVVEFAARQAEDAGRLSTRTRPIADLLREADFHAAQAGLAQTGREQVQAALAARERRGERVSRAFRQEILDGTLLISTDGGHVGQINGLAVTELGDHSFGHPVRITATARFGEGELVDIERETELGGPIHAKGVMILSAFLAARFAQNRPLSLAASIVFEQSYGPVEGDSASLAELCALVSALADVPIHQHLAVTGSVNQHGVVQAIGGVNEKIEGFFDLCLARGLDGSQGVVIPRANVRHLMLREDVVAAAAAGKFQVWAVDTVDEALEILTGLPAGKPDSKGLVEPGTVHERVSTRLTDLSYARQSFNAGSGRRKKKRHDEL